MKSQRGNALWFILIAVALLGILTAVMSRGGGSSGDTGRYEQETILASDILRYAASIENTVQTLMVRGCSENEISFENSLLPTYTNPDAPTDESCHVFEPEGGGLSFIDWSEKMSSSVSGPSRFGFAGRSEIFNVGTDCAAASPRCAELYIFFRMYHAADICAALNRNTIGSNTVPTAGGVFGTPAFTGTFTTGVATTLGTAGNGPIFAGEKAGCYQDTNETHSDGTPFYDFYYVLHER
jgi:hypothetical protein